MTLLLVDASSLIYRAWFALPDSMKGPAGEPVNAVHGFIDMLARLVATRQPAGLVCCFDDDWRPEWRVALLPEYKAARVAEDGEEIAGPEEQIPVVRELLGVAGIACAGAPGSEAEDAIGTLVAHSKKGPIGIVSGDRDLFQLVRDPDVSVLYPRKGVSDLTVVDEAWIEAKYAIPGRAYLDFAVLRGDPSDGLPGVRGIGEKSAASLIRAHGSLPGVVAAASAADAPKNGPLAKVAAQLDYVERATKVARIASDAPIGRVRVALPASLPAAFVEAAEKAGVFGPAQRLAAAVASRKAG